ncbi:MAG: TcdA/TcdB catalytic glycosyltransferase domain-containing protein [Pantoea sp.]|nr:TcdA/TcdB catalytic glycosyltransferase domain-containing protein [Pantoea sp.]
MCGRDPLNTLDLCERKENKNKNKNKTTNANLNPIHLLIANKNVIPDIIHFIWIGTNKNKNKQYINIWKQANKDKKIVYWVDKDSYFFETLQKILKESIFHKYLDKIKREEELVKIRNEAFNFIWNNIDRMETTFSLAKKFLEAKNIANWEKRLEGIDDDINDEMNNAICLEKQISTLFSDGMEIFKKFYYYELILRRNYACASDLIRIILLKKFGGIYIDVDTLPYFDDSFKYTNNLLFQEGLKSSEHICIAKSQAFLDLKNGNSYNEKKIINIIKEEKTIDNPQAYKLSEAIKKDILKRIIKIKPLGKIKCPQNGILLSTLNCLRGVFFNNILCSHKGTIFSNLLLRRILRYYQYIENNGHLFQFCNFDQSLTKNKSTFGILRYYRNDRFNNNDFVTYYLSGPKLIVSTITFVIKLSSGKLNDRQIFNYLCTLQDDEKGIGFINQTLDTPGGLESKWRNQ